MNNYFDDPNDGEIYSNLTPEERKYVMKIGLVLGVILFAAGLTIYLM